jgi:phage baseplate assembly protein W
MAAGDDLQLGREFLGTGWAFPVGLASDTGLVERIAYEDDIKQSIRIILGTSKGERVMRPDFGCGIHDLVFAAVSTQVMTQIETTVRDALRTYEARIDVLRVDVDGSELGNGRLLVTIDYLIRATNQPDNYVYPFYFEQSASR